MSGAHVVKAGAAGAGQGGVGPAGAAGTAASASGAGQGAAASAGGAATPAGAATALGKPAASASASGVETGAGTELANAHVAIFGMGLLGGSIARALKARGQCRRLSALVRSPANGEAALRAGAADEYALLPDGADGVSDELGRMLGDVDLAVLCTPVPAMEALVKACASFFKAGCVLTDVGSVKALPTEALPGLLPPGVAYVGAHPMAGGHLGGFAHARADLFEGSVCVVTPPEGDAASAPPRAVQQVEALFTALGARVLRRTPEAHDAQVAWISHAPHAVAYAFSAAQQQAPGEAAALRGTGFRDFTRIAGSDPELWADLLLANRAQIRAPLCITIKALESLLSALEAGDRRALLEQLAVAQAALGAPARPQDAGQGAEGAGRHSQASLQESTGSDRPGGPGAKDRSARAPGRNAEQHAKAALAASRSHSS